MADESIKPIAFTSKTMGKTEKEKQYNYCSQENSGPRCFQEEITLYTIFNRLITALCFPDDHVSNASAPLLLRIKGFLAENAPLLELAFKNSTRHLILWTRRGSPFRSILVVSVGTIALLALTGLLVFMLLFVAVTVNAVVISLLMSIAAAGGFLVILCPCVAAIYVVAVTVALFVISATTITAIFATLVATGWIIFFTIIWLGTKRGVGMMKRSLSMD